jgi:hypothetical protein
MSDNPLNAQQIQQIQKQAVDQVEAYLNRLQLRKWAIDQSLPHGTSPGEIISIAQALYDFVVQPLKLDLTP